ncbi:hypothetical protein ACIGXA_06255 [Streptomyces fildesensis]|uniref:MmpS family membrane protein n=1 Tax=Streptomyces fildesensis TaxID=375757 RepID=A0ABW8C2J2_9ACTN
MSYQQPQGWGQPQQPQAPQAPPAKRKRSGCLTAFIAVAAFCVVIGVIATVANGGKKDSDDKAGTPTASAPAAAPGSQKAATTGQAPKPTSKAPAAETKAAAETVTYVVEGSTAEVTYGPAGSSFSGKVPLKVTKPLGTPMYYSITAQLQGGGHVKCSILVNGKVISKAEASGSYNIAMCQISQDFGGDGWVNTNG